MCVPGQLHECLGPHLPQIGELSMQDALAIEHELVGEGPIIAKKLEARLGLTDMQRLLLSDANSAFDAAACEARDDMSRPLHEYFTL